MIAHDTSRVPDCISRMTARLGQLKEIVEVKIRPSVALTRYGALVILIALIAAASFSSPSASTGYVFTPTALGPTDFLVADVNGTHLAVFDQNLAFKGFFDEMLSQPSGLDFLPNGNIVGLSRNAIQVRQYDTSGNHISSFTSMALGSTPLEIKSNKALLPADFRLYFGIDGVSVPELDLAGTKIRGFGSNSYDAVAVLPGNVMWAGGTGFFGFIDVFNIASGSGTGNNIAPTITITLDNGQSIASSMSYSSATNTVLMADLDNNKIFERMTNGTFVRAFTPPMGSSLNFGVTRGPSNDVFASDSMGDTIVRWHSDGTLVGATALAPNVQQPANIIWAGNNNVACMLTCPANQIANTGPGATQCCAVVTFSDPTTSGTCGTIGCSPVSGACFPVGTTTVTCATVQDGPSCTFTVTVTDSTSPTITCPANQIKCNDPNQCGAVVAYPDPTADDNCPGVSASCNPASGSFFAVGTTTATCTATDANGNMSTCSFTVKVNDCQAPSITCPANITAVTAKNVCPSPACTAVSFSPTASDNCPGVTVMCSPASGACFPVGTTTVTCTATDTSGNTFTCTFTVTVFDVCIQDDSNPNTVLLFNSLTGDSCFCCNGTKFTGKGKVTTQGCIITLEVYAPDRRVVARIDKGVFRGTASLQSPPGRTKCTITDRDVRNNTCNCQ